MPQNGVTGKTIVQVILKQNLVEYGKFTPTCSSTTQVPKCTKGTITLNNHHQIDEALPKLQLALTSWNGQADLV